MAFETESGTEVVVIALSTNAPQSIQPRWREIIDMSKTGRLKTAQSFSILDLSLQLLPAITRVTLHDLDVSGRPKVLSGELSVSAAMECVS